MPRASTAPSLPGFGCIPPDAEAGAEQQRPAAPGTRAVRVIGSLPRPRSTTSLSGLAAVGALLLAASLGPACAASQSARASTGLAYYVSPTGDDAADGTSPATAWRTLSRATAAQLAPGAQLLLEGGARFTGPLAFTREDAGDPSDPVYVGAYGQGPATITAPSGSGIVIYDTAGDRKSTRLNSSHSSISYAVFCLKK